MWCSLLLAAAALTSGAQAFFKTGCAAEGDMICESHRAMCRAA